jgi:hypothetical protein
MQNKNSSSDYIFDNHQTETSFLLEQAKSSVQDALEKFSNSSDFVRNLQLVFGDNLEADILETTWQAKEIVFPEIEIVSHSEINHANGAFAKETNKIYLAQEFLAANINNLDVITNVLLEEYGHYVDSQLNITDTPGDEGAILASVVQGEELDENVLRQLKNEDDSVVVVLDEEEVAIEQNDDPIFISSRAVWTETTDALYVNGIDTNEIRWGDPVGSEQSGLRFDGVDISGFSLDEPFELGTLTHFNNLLNDIETAASKAELEVTFDFTNLGGTISLPLSFDVDETLNGPDLITFPYAPNTKNQHFYHDREKYTFQIIGFGSDVNNLESGLISEEENTNETKLFGLLTKGDGQKQTISTNQTIDGDLSPTDYYDPSRTGYRVDDYILERGTGTDGQEVQIKLESTEFDTYLQIIDVKTGEIIEDDDDSGDERNSFINFELDPNRKYIVRVGGYSENTVGDYTLTTTSFHKVLEYFAKEIAYNEYKPNDIGRDVGYFYKIGEIFKNDSTGLDALGLISTQPGNAPILVFRGTQPTEIVDIISDTRPKGIGFDQFEQNQPEIIKWLKTQQENNPELKPRHI